MNAEIEDNIRRNVTWSQLPSHVKQLLGNSAKEYGKCVVTFSIRNQLRYRGNLVKQILRNEKRYYERVIAYSIERLMLFPYHLADMIVKGLRITPFSYYVAEVEKLMQAERSYDTLPNFTAADCLRLLNIGRNEYIEIMNRSRSNRSRLFGKRNVRVLLPRVPCDVKMEPWWRVEIGMVLEEDIKMVNVDELKLIDRLIDCGSQTAGELDHNTVLSLYKKGLIYLDVPVTAFDRVQVPPLQGFVMNRILGDYFETLLYKIFVSIDEHMTIGELAAVLEVETELVKQAVSLYLRLGFARKLDADTEQERARRHASWVGVAATTEVGEAGRGSPLRELSMCSSGSASDLLSDFHYVPSENSPTYSSTLSRSGLRVAFLFDSTLTAFLMMGNLSPGLKKHAVTMFEVGKLCDESLDSFLIELEKVSLLDAEGEGEARRFFDHAVILRSTVLALKKLPSAGLDLIRLESLHSLEEAACNRLVQKKYKLLVSMAPLSREVRPVCSLTPPHLGPAVPEVNSIWFKLFLYHVTGYGPPTLLLKKGTTLKQLPRMFLGFSKLLVAAWFHEPAILPAVNILHVNASLQYAPVLIQAYGAHHTARTHLKPFPFRPDTPTKGEGECPFSDQWLTHPAICNLMEVVDLSRNCGYVTMVNIGVRDFGCAQRDHTVHLRRTEPKRVVVGVAKPEQHNSSLSHSSESLTLINENFAFVDEQSSGHLQSPVESHFALTPPSSGGAPSPANGFVDQHSRELIGAELDRLEEQQQQQDVLHVVVDGGVEGGGCARNLILSESLTSPMEEHVSMFSRAINEESGGDGCGNLYESHRGEAWTLLDCYFGIPLFDVDANTKICDSIVGGGLAEASSLQKLTESSRKLGTALLEFISQCQYYPGENMGIIKRGRLTPLPKHNLAFDNGRIKEWSGK